MKLFICTPRFNEIEQDSKTSKMVNTSLVGLNEELRWLASLVRVQRGLACHGLGAVIHLKQGNSIDARRQFQGYPINFVSAHIDY